MGGEERKASERTSPSYTDTKVLVFFDNGSVKRVVKFGSHV